MEFRESQANRDRQCALRGRGQETRSPGPQPPSTVRATLHPCNRCRSINAHVEPSAKFFVYLNSMKITFNAPVVLGFTCAAAIIMGLSVTIFPGINVNYFASTGYFDYGRIADYFRLFSHIFGHENWAHLMGNFSIILLIGPILEEKYGSKKLLIMILFTAVATGIFNNVFWDYGLMGASGIVFMMILLGSLVNFSSGTIPITFILIAALYLGQEIYNALAQDDQISQFAHIMGGVCGMFFGFALGKGGLATKIPGMN